jgi:hypothetical protein
MLGAFITIVIGISIAQIYMWKKDQMRFTSSITLTWLFTYPRLLYLYNNCDITFLTVFILTHPVNFPCGRKPEYPEKTHDFRQRRWLTQSIFFTGKPPLGVPFSHVFNLKVGTWKFRQKTLNWCHDFKKASFCFNITEFQ